MCVSNPPYIGRDEQATVMPQVFAHEPHEALFSQDDGLAHIVAIVRQCTGILKAQGMLLLEHGAQQGQRVREVLAQNGYGEIITRRDMAGLERCTAARWPGAAG